MAAEFSLPELETFLAIADTFVPPLPTPGQLTPEFASATPSDCPEFVHEIRNVLPGNIPAAKLAELKRVLSLLSGRAGLVLTWHWTPLAQLPRSKREVVLLGWKNSRIPLLKTLFNTVSVLIINTYLRTDGRALRAMGYPGTSVAASVQPRTGGFPFEFKGIRELLPPVAEFDVVIIGSGSGGGVTAQTLAEAGWRVLVVEKGSHIPGNVVMTEKEGFEKRYEQNGQLTNVAGDMILLAGNTWGGGSAVNWAASLQTPAAVRRDWVDQHGLEYFGSRDFQDDLDHVCDFMGVTAPKHNPANKALLDGARLLGMSAAAVPQNTGGGTHTCNHTCSNSCPTGQKKGSHNSWLVSAATHGAVFTTNTYATQLTFSPSGKRVTGVLLQTESGTHQLPCRKIVLSGGALNTPPLLLRSKVVNPHIGKHLRLHPVSIFYGHFPEPIDPWEGNILTSVISEYANVDHRGHGVRIEAMTMLPAIGCTFLPWRSGEEWKKQAADYRHLASYISIVRDRDGGGCVTLDPITGGPQVDYTVSEFDLKNMITGVETATEVLVAGGADRVITTFADVPDFVAGETDFDEWRTKLRTAHGGCSYASAHQMASCRMGATREEGVCDEEGKVWGVEGLWVADASVLPSGSGVNPMVTTMATARGIARGIRDKGVGMVEARL